MNQNLAKPVPVRLDDREYGELREQVLRRDSWRCQFCGSMTNLEVHHQQFRSHSGRTTKTISLPSAIAATRQSTGAHFCGRLLVFASPLTEKEHLYESGEIYRYGRSSGHHLRCRDGDHCKLIMEFLLETKAVTIIESSEGCTELRCLLSRKESQRLGYTIL